MAKQLLTEFNELCKDGICRDLLNEREKREMDNGVLYLSGRIQTADKKNGNGRSYPFKILKREIDNYKKIVADNRACGELDHPDLINAGVKLGISSRGLGSVKESMGSTVVQEDFELICFDIVSEPSTPNAFVYPKSQRGMYENKINEAKQNIVDDLFKKILED